MLPFSQPPGDEIVPVTPKSAEIVESLLISLSSEVESLKAG